MEIPVTRHLPLNEKFNNFKINGHSVDRILITLRTELTDRLLLLKERLEQEENDLFSLNITCFHPKVVEVAGRLFEDGH